MIIQDFANIKYINFNDNYKSYFNSYIKLNYNVFFKKSSHIYNYNHPTHIFHIINKRHFVLHLPLEYIDRWLGFIIHFNHFPISYAKRSALPSLPFRSSISLIIIPRSLYVTSLPITSALLLLCLFSGLAPSSPNIDVDPPPSPSDWTIVGCVFRLSNYPNALLRWQRAIAPQIDGFITIKREQNITFDGCWKMIKCEKSATIRLVKFAALFGKVL